MSFWNIRLIFWNLINSFKHTLVFLLHITSKWFRQDSNYRSSVVGNISNSMFLISFTINLWSITSQNIWFNFIFNFRLIIIFKSFIIFNGFWMFVGILFWSTCYLVEYLFNSLVLILGFGVRDLNVVDIVEVIVNVAFNDSGIFEILGFYESDISSFNIW